MAQRTEIRLIGFVTQVKVGLLFDKSIEYQFREVGIDNDVPIWLSAPLPVIPPFVQKTSASKNEEDFVAVHFKKRISHQEQMLEKFKEALTKPTLFWTDCFVEFDKI